MSMTLQQVQDKVHTLYDTTDTTTPASTTDDWKVRASVAETAVDTWAAGKRKWVELRKPKSYTLLAADVTNGYITLDSDFVDLWSDDVYVKTAAGVRRRFAVIKPEDVGLYVTNSSYRYAYVEGNEKDGYKLQIKNGSLVAGEIVELDYLKTPFKPSAVGDTFEMSDSSFVIQYVLHVLFEADGENDRSLKHYQEANGFLESMWLSNVAALAHQPDNVQEGDREGAGFGA